MVKVTPKLAPIRIRKGALGDGLPLLDLWVSPQHRMLAKSRIVERMTGKNEALVAAHKLTQLPGVKIDDYVRQVCYFHILTDAHEIVFANGAPSETLWPGPQARTAMGPEAWSELISIFPEMAVAMERYPPARMIPSNQKQKHLIRRHRRNNVPLFEGFL